MNIINRDGHIKLVYNTKLIKKTKKYKTKAGEKSYQFFQGFLPFEIENYLEIEDRKLYFYENNGRILLTSREPREQHEMIKLQKVNQYSLPRRYFKEINEDNIILTVDFGRKDPYTRREGLISIRLE